MQDDDIKVELSKSKDWNDDLKKDLLEKGFFYTPRGIVLCIAQVVGKGVHPFWKSDAPDLKKGCTRFKHSYSLSGNAQNHAAPGIKHVNRNKKSCFHSA
jgi:hypothetical protein